MPFEVVVRARGVPGRPDVADDVARVHVPERPVRRQVGVVDEPRRPVHRDLGTAELRRGGEGVAGEGRHDRRADVGVDVVALVPVHRHARQADHHAEVVGQHQGTVHGAGPEGAVDREPRSAGGAPLLQAQDTAPHGASGPLQPSVQPPDGPPEAVLGRHPSGMAHHQRRGQSPTLATQPHDLRAQLLHAVAVVACDLPQLAIDAMNLRLGPRDGGQAGGGGEGAGRGQGERSDQRAHRHEGQRTPCGRRKGSARIDI